MHKQNKTVAVEFTQSELRLIHGALHCAARNWETYSPKAGLYQLADKVWNSGVLEFYDFSGQQTGEEKNLRGTGE